MNGDKYSFLMSSRSTDTAVVLAASAYWIQRDLSGKCVSAGK